MGHSTILVSYRENPPCPLCKVGGGGISTIGGYSVSVVKAEHLIALKVFAMKNDSERAFREMADLQQLLRLPGIDREEVRGYFEKCSWMSAQLIGQEWPCRPGLS